MSDKTFNPRNLLVIDFGQLGDVVLSLPALRAIRSQFPTAQITVAAGKPGAEIVKLAGVANDVLAVDRVGLRDGAKVISIFKVFRLVKDVRKRQFDFIIDLHSLSETNLLGFLSGAPHRLYSRRPARSLDFLANFRPRPPVETDHRKRHLIDRYLDVLLPLGVKDADRCPRLATNADDNRAVEQILKKAKADAGTPLVGIFPGAGHPSRRWPVSKFAELADFLVRNDRVRVVVFVGPEERAILPQLRQSFPDQTVMLEKMSLGQLAAAAARLAVFISNDTGPMHVAAAVGTPVVLLLDKRAPNSYLPLGERHQVLTANPIDSITVEDAYTAARSILTAVRVATLFAS